MPTDYERVRDAIAYISENALEQPSLDDVAGAVGLSGAHFQRIFSRWAGVSPKRFLQQLTAVRAQELLRDSVSVLDTAFAVGLSGSGRLHDLMISTAAVTPGEYASGGSGIEIRYGVHPTPFGECVIGTTDRGICALRFVADGSSAADTLDELHAEWPRATFARDDIATARLCASIFAAPDRRTGTGAGPITLLLRGTNFQLRVWEALVRIPPGCLISYGDLAARLGEPSATRAVAAAVGANPIAYAIPCHRVLRTSGALGGYRWGLDRKLVMLERESLASGAEAARSTR